MLTTSLLNEYYGSFFTGAAAFAASPYIVGYSSGRLLVGGHLPGNEDWENDLHKAGLLVTLALTVIPVLPALTAITFSVALFASALALVSAAVTYPIAGMIDSVSLCAF